jgi:hypothetical protein
MPLQNRIDPWGRLHAHPSKAGTVMGNRGILHNKDRVVVRSWAGKSWVACDPKFESIDRRPLFQEHRYSELFFLDEATAFSAGHRPCAYCRRARFEEFKSAWAAVHYPGRPASEIKIKEIDNQLHLDRAFRGGEKVTFEASLGDLPDGTMISADGMPLLLHHGGLLRWTFDGYERAGSLSRERTVEVLTPRPIVELFRNGFTPSVHESANA